MKMNFRLNLGKSSYSIINGKNTDEKSTIIINNGPLEYKSVNLKCNHMPVVNEKVGQCRTIQDIFGQFGRTYIYHFNRRI